MINVESQNKNENVIYREKRKTISVKDKFDTLGLYEKIINELDKSEKIYDFPHSNGKDIKVYDKNNYNPFFMHDEQMYFLFQKVSLLIKNTCEKYQFSYLKNKYFIYSSLISNFVFSESREIIPNIEGLDVPPASYHKEGSWSSINEEEFEVEPGAIIISEAGNKIVYSNKFKSIVFYVSPLSEIKNQYSQKWIPLV